MKPSTDTENYADELNGYIPFAATIGLIITKATRAHIEGEVDIRHEVTNPYENAHGGLLMSMADMLGACGAGLNMPEGKQSSLTTESKTNFIKPAALGDTLIGIATPISRGRLISVWQTEIRRKSDDVLVAVITQSQIYL